MCDFLYHYSTFDPLEKIIQSKKFWMGSSLTMNDPTDRCYGVCSFSKYLQSNAPLAKEIRGEIPPEKAVQIAFKGIKQSYYTVSFAETPDNQCLLDRYAAHGTGVIFELNKNQFERSVSCLINRIDNESFTAVNGVEFPVFRKVHYEEDVAFIEDKIKEVIEKERTILPKICKTDTEKNELLIAYISYLVSGVLKDKFWKEEEEVRLLFKYEMQKHASNYWKEEIQEGKMLETNEDVYKKKIYDVLGLSEEKTDEKTGKKHLSFNLENFWGCGIVKRIFVSKKQLKKAEEILEKNKIESIKIESF